MIGGGSRRSRLPHHSRQCPVAAEACDRGGRASFSQPPCHLRASVVKTARDEAMPRDGTDVPSPSGDSTQRREFRTRGFVDRAKEYPHNHSSSASQVPSQHPRSTHSGLFVIRTIFKRASTRTPQFHEGSSAINWTSDQSNFLGRRTSRAISHVMAGHSSRWSAGRTWASRRSSMRS